MVRAQRQQAAQPPFKAQLRSIAASNPVRKRIDAAHLGSRPCRKGMDRAVSSSKRVFKARVFDARVREACSNREAS